MSDGKEVKRFQLGELLSKGEHSLLSEWTSAPDHDRTVAELRAEVERLTGEVVRRNQYKLNQEMLDVAHKVYEERIARQARVRDYLYTELNYYIMDCGRKQKEQDEVDAAIAAIERAEGGKGD